MYLYIIYVCVSVSFTVSLSVSSLSLSLSLPLPLSLSLSITVIPAKPVAITSNADTARTESLFSLEGGSQLASVEAPAAVAQVETACRACVCVCVYSSVFHVPHYV